MDTEENIALFDRYLLNDLDVIEHNAFEERLNTSSSFRVAFEQYVNFKEDLKESFEYHQILKEIADVAKKVKPAPLKDKKNNIPLILKPKLLIPLGIAATIALLVFINPFGMDSKADSMAGNYEPLENESADSYEASKEIIQEESTLDSTNLNSTNTHLLLDSVGLMKFTPKGTAFLMSNDGYFLTAKHLLDERKVYILQEKTNQISFEVSLIYTDTLMDLAILKCSDKMAAKFKKTPYAFVSEAPGLGEDVFTLGYPKKDVVYTKGVVSSETGFNSDSIYFEVSLPSNAGHSGAPLFDSKGKLIGIITAQQTEKQSVTYVLKHNYILKQLDLLKDSLAFSLPNGNFTGNNKKRISNYRNFIFELH